MFTDIKIKFKDKEMVFENLKKFTVFPDKPTKAYLINTKKVIEKAIDKNKNEISGDEYNEKLKELESKGYWKDGELKFEKWKDERNYKDFIHNYNLVYKNIIHLEEIPIIEYAEIKKDKINDYIHVNVTHIPENKEKLIGYYDREKAIRDKILELAKDYKDKLEITDNVRFSKLFDEYIFLGLDYSFDNKYGIIEDLINLYNKDMKLVNYKVKKIISKYTEPIEFAKQIIELFDIENFKNKISQISVKNTKSKEIKNSIMKKLNALQDKIYKFMEISK